MEPKAKRLNEKFLTRLLFSEEMTKWAVQNSLTAGFTQLKVK